ncbi:MAG: pilus assembly protein PilM [Parcubacteria group bacterium]|nr:pilus assembly protein PilM [Parcubacteria group bacterium]
MAFSFFKKRAFGLDISDGSLKAVLLSQGPRPQIECLGVTDLPPGIIEKGIVREPSRLLERLRDFFRARLLFGSLSTRAVVVTLPEAQVYTQYYTVPRAVPESDISSYIAAEAAQSIPIPSGERVDTFRTHAVGAHFREIAFAAAFRPIVAVWHEVLLHAGLEPIAFEPELAALVRALSPNYDGSAAYLLADLGARSVDIGIVEQNQLRFSSTAPVGGVAMTSALASALKIPFGEAERLKRANGLDGNTHDTLYRTLAREMTPVINEIQRTITFWNTRQHAPIDRILLAGGTGMMAGLAPYLEKILKTPVRAGDPWIAVDVSPVLAHTRLARSLAEEPLLYGTSIGSALRGCSRDPEREGLNLFEDFTHQKGRRSRLFSLLSR